MESKGALIAGIVFVFGSFIMMIVLLVYESYKTKRQQEMVATVQTVPKAAPTAVRQDFSVYKTIVGDEGREMVQIPEGPFTMGSDDGDPDETPEHQVYLKSYYIDTKEVTQQEYDRFYRMTKRGKPFIPVFEEDISNLQGLDLPAIGMSWSDAFAYCRWAGKRLPTEAEWEKAARGEGKRKYTWGDTFEMGHANLDGKDDGFKYLAPPASFESGRSPYGVYDMIGNVSEWVADTYEKEYYRETPYRDPKGPGDGDHKVIRGGSWRESPHGARTTNRFPAKMWLTDATIGIRCAKDVDSQGKT